MLRPATLADASAIYALEQRCFATPEETFTRRQVRYALASPRAVAFVAEQDGRIIGWSVALIRRAPRWLSGRIYAVAVDPTMQGRGLGRLLTTALLDAMTQRRVARVYLEVRCDNLGAIALYRSLGFTDHDFLAHYYADDLHAYRLRLLLPDAATFRAQTTPRISTTARTR